MKFTKRTLIATISIIYGWIKNTPNLKLKTQVIYCCSRFSGSTCVSWVHSCNSGHWMEWMYSPRCPHSRVIQQCWLLVLLPWASLAWLSSSNRSTASSQHGRLKAELQRTSPNHRTNESLLDSCMFMAMGHSKSHGQVSPGRDLDSPHWWETWKGIVVMFNSSQK